MLLMHWNDKDIIIFKGQIFKNDAKFKKIFRLIFSHIKYVDKKDGWGSPCIILQTTYTNLEVLYNH